MTDHDKSQGARRNDKTVGMSQRLLAAVSLLGVSLGVSAAAPAAPIAAADDAVADLVVKVAENKLSNPGTISGMGWDVRTQSDQLKQKGDTKTIHIDQFQTDQLKQKGDGKTIHIDDYKFQSNQKKGANALPAVQSNQYK
ncbi:MAG TPA: hypothetical protein VGN55_07295 [Xanthobacteraceae bacterium]|jgi:hypothetical protein